MKLHVHPGPLPILPPHFEWDDHDDDPMENEVDIDLTDLFENPTEAEGANKQLTAGPRPLTNPVAS